jgi:hypothetical protein
MEDIIYNFMNMKKIKDMMDQKNITNNDSYTICTVADVLHLTEEHKKIRKIDNLVDKYNFFIEKYNNGEFDIANLSHEKLKQTLFAGDYRENQLYIQACNREISPRKSVALLSMRESDENWWWSESIWNEFIENYGG